MTLHTIPPYIYAGLQRYHQESFMTRRVGFSSSDEQIIYVVANQFGVSVNDIMSASRMRLFTEARHFAIYFIRKYTNKTLEQIGILLNRNHSTILYAIGVAEDLMQTNWDYKQSAEKIENKIKELAGEFSQSE